MDRRAEMIRFGNDGWKTRYDDGFTVENVIRLVDGLGGLWAQLSAGATVYVGYDTRRDSERFAREVAGVLSAHGLSAKVSDAACPTPAVAWACARDEKAVGALVVTASELSCDYGGVIVRADDGGPCPREFLEEIEQEVPSAPTSERGSYSVCDLVGPYLRDLAEHADASLISARAPKIVVDPMYGAAKGRVASMLRSLGCECVEIHAEDDPAFGGIHPAPADPWGDDCEQEVINSHADMGIMLDGDADRAAIVDEKGRLLPVREFVPLVIEAISKGLAPKADRVVATLTSSSLIERKAESCGMGFTPVSVGFPYIYSELGEGDVALGAEEYGGVCIPAHLKERDGIYATLLVVELLALSGKPLSELVDAQERDLGKTTWLRRDVRIDAASAQALRNILPGLNPAELAGKKPVEVSHADGLKLTFEDGSWVLARPARTESVVRIYAEAPDAVTRDAMLEAIADAAISGPNI